MLVLEVGVNIIDIIKIFQVEFEESKEKINDFNVMYEVVKIECDNLCFEKIKLILLRLISVYFDLLV